MKMFYGAKTTYFTENPHLKNQIPKSEKSMKR